MVNEGDILWFTANSIVPCEKQTSAFERAFD
jgi:hypothetical protein